MLLQYFRQSRSANYSFRTSPRESSTRVNWSLVMKLHLVLSKSWSWFLMSILLLETLHLMYCNNWWRSSYSSEDTAWWWESEVRLVLAREWSKNCWSMLLMKSLYLTRSPGSILYLSTREVTSSVERETARNSMAVAKADINLSSMQ